MREIHRLTTHTVEFEGIKPRKNVSCNTPNGDRLPRAHDPVGEEHRPACHETQTGAAEGAIGIGDFAASVGNGLYQPAVDITDRHQRHSARSESEHSS